MTSAAVLQAHYDEIQANMPVLPLATAPKGYVNLDIEALEPSLHSRVTRALDKAAAGLQQCQICSRSSTADSLGFHISTQLDFKSRTVKAVGGQFACSLCRAVSTPSFLLQLATPVLGSEDYARSQALQELFLHFAAVNSAPASITGNSEALAVWAQELACRAYSMQVVASRLRGWMLVGPSGQLVQQGAAGAGLKLLQQLLGPQQQQRGSAEAVTTAAAKPGKKSSSKTEQQLQAVVTAEQQKQQRSDVGMAGKRKKGRQETAPEAAAAEGSTKKKAKKHKAAAATVDGDVAESPVGPELAAAAAVTPKHRQKHHKQQQQDTSAQKKHRKLTTPGKAGSKPPAAAAAAGVEQAAVPFKTPQVVKTKKAAKAGKRRLSDPS